MTGVQLGMLASVQVDTTVRAIQRMERFVDLWEGHDQCLRDGLFALRWHTESTSLAATSEVQERWQRLANAEDELKEENSKLETRKMEPDKKQSELNATDKLNAWATR